MARPRRDGEPPAPPRRERITELAVTRTKSEPTAFNIWDTGVPGLVLRIQPSGHRAFKVVYRRNGRPCWYDLGEAKKIGLEAARDRAKRIAVAVLDGKDPIAERKAQRSAGTFAELAETYVNEHAKKKNKSWRQADHLVRRYLVPRWGMMQV